MLQSVQVNFSETGTLDIAAKGITIFVGPNNSGKSLILKEIESIVSHYPAPQGMKIVQDFEVDWPESEVFHRKIEQARLNTPPDTPQGHIRFGRLNPVSGREQLTVNLESLDYAIRTKNEKGWFSASFVKWGLIRLDGRSRFALTDDQTGGDLQQLPQNILSHLFQDDESRSEARRIIKDAFNINFYIDPTNLGSLRIKLSNSLLTDDEQSLSAVARQFYRTATHIKEASDGVQAFTGIITAVLSGEYHTILVDEPEAFLHPPLARKLGKNLASLAAQKNASLMAATHSSDFLMGCVQASPSVRVIRLEYSNGKSRARSIDSSALNKFLKRPLMRSANVISGLFHDGVVVLESDNDRAFYNEIYHRMMDTRPDFPSILFVNAQNKQTIREIIGPLREFGVPAAAIPDIDIIKDGGRTWNDWMRSCQIPNAMHLGLGQQRSAIHESFKSTGKDMKTDGGIGVLSKQDNVAAQSLFDTLEIFGVFPVRRGEVENWLPNLSVAGKKTDWAVAMLERLGDDAADVEYVRPDGTDVWEFMGRVVNWITNPARLGTS